MIVRGNQRKPGTKASKPSIRLSASEKAAIEKALTPYLHLLCGHMVTREIAVLFSVFAPNIKDVYCDKCDVWTELKPKKRYEYPDNPLF